MSVSRIYSSANCTVMCTLATAMSVARTDTSTLRTEYSKCYVCGFFEVLG